MSPALSRPALLPTHLALLDAVRTQLVPEADLPAALITEGIAAGLIRRVIPPTEGEPVTISLTALGLETALSLRPQGIPLLGLDITRHGLRVTQELTPETWLFGIRNLRLVKEAYHNALADLVRYGRQNFGDDYVDARIEQLEFPFEDIKHAEAIGCVPYALRASVQLTSEHYYILGIFFAEDLTSQQMWADRATKHNLSPIALRRSIEQGTIITDTDRQKQIGHGSGLKVLNGVSLHFTRWRKQAGDLPQIRTWPPDQIAAVLEEIGDIVEFALELRKSLDGHEELDLETSQEDSRRD